MTALGFFVAPASAAAFNLTLATGFGGSVQGSGTIDFLGKFRFNHSTQVKDLCPADGKGALVYFVLTLGDGDQSFTTEYKNLQGCGTTRSFNAEIERNRRIMSVRAVVCYTENGNSQQCTIGAVHTNPFN